MAIINNEVYRQLLRITVEKEVGENLEFKSSDYKDGFHDGCWWLNEYTKALIESYFGKRDDKSVV